MNSNSQEFAKQMIRIIEQLFLLEKNNTFLHENKLKLYASEIHLVLIINEGYTKNITEMANRLQITKGAVSQTLSRLEAKGVLLKTKDPYNKNELSVAYTPLGKKVLKNCLRLQSYLYDNFASYFLSLSKNDQKVLSNFLLFMQGLLKFREK
jgi:DNA-binding MarR family transcriptional regulator